MPESFRNFSKRDFVNMYSLEMKFPELIRRSGHYQPDPFKAEYHYVHIYTYHAHHKEEEGVSAGRERAEAVVRELRKLGHWWDLNRGTHIFPLPSDRAACRLPWGIHLPGYEPVIRGSIGLQHYGGVGRGGVLPYFSEECNITKMWASNCDMSLAFSQFHGRAEPNVEQPQQCYVPGKDLLVPTVETENTGTTRYLNHSLAAIRRTKLLFFAGMTESPFYNQKWPFSDAGYSGGVRQTVMRMYQNDSRFLLLKNGANLPNYFELMASAVFCLAPMGIGWGARV
ncbi:hypothetical protein CEUSTIGMA_g8790.t1 [Chlamydomonas eustigma]|uniref:Exostosin GT47 domain-containing protein n=1 Tax=Chlamydomonas eustigma TaxID=1157962 RepID=A0A250XEK7_9CHLO|nr:hypothetical protein CEUSTIGMA_g8790.t1 [Chlamydomonas eustigma]|eukprot:GAX81359.1 hypothetical protein CEUSTIGMA_g8790.t1 [Chlamydomonas eustigma]